MPADPAQAQPRRPKSLGSGRLVVRRGAQAEVSNVLRHRFPGQANRRYTNNPSGTKCGSGHAFVGALISAVEDLCGIVEGGIDGFARLHREF